MEVLFRNLNLDRVRDVLMGAYHRFGAGRPPFNPLGLLRFKVILVLKGYRSQRGLEGEVRVDSRVRWLCGFNVIPSHSTVVRFERRIGVERLKRLISHVIEDLVIYGFIKGLKVVLDSKPFEARCRRDPKNPSRGWLDEEARLGRGVRGFVMGYKVHLACDGESDMSLSFTVAPANENDKRHAIPLLSEAAEKVNVEAVICACMHNGQCLLQCNPNLERIQRKNPATRTSPRRKKHRTRNRRLRRQNIRQKDNHTW